MFQNRLSVMDSRFFLCLFFNLQICALRYYFSFDDKLYHSKVKASHIALETPLNQIICYCLLIASIWNHIKRTRAVAHLSRYRPNKSYQQIKVFVERGGFEPPKLLKVTERLPRSPFVLCHLRNIFSLVSLKAISFSYSLSLHIF